MMAFLYTCWSSSSGLASITHCTCDMRIWLISHTHVKQDFFHAFCPFLGPEYGQYFYNYRYKTKTVACVSPYLLHNNSFPLIGDPLLYRYTLLASFVPNCVTILVTTSVVTMWLIVVHAHRAKGYIHCCFSYCKCYTYDCEVHIQTDCKCMFNISARTYT